MNTRAVTAPRVGEPSARVRLLGTVAGLLLVSGLACRENSGPPPLRLWTNDLAFRVSTNPVPPPARQDIVFTVVVHDRNTGKAIEGGEGRVYATSADRVNTWDGLTPGTQPGTYTAKLNFLTSGNWAMGMQFRRDSTAPIETLDNWTQEVMAASGEADIK
jgi:hypothetical protein